jgi:hypothetical protein
LTGLSSSIIIPQFAQIPRGLSKIFKIMPKEDVKLEDVEILLYDDIIYQGKYLNATDLRAFLYLSAKLSSSRKDTQLLKTAVEIYESNRYIVRSPILKWNPYIGVRQMLKFFDLKPMSENISIASKSLEKFSNSYIQTSTFKSKLISCDFFDATFSPIFASLFKPRFTNHSLTPKFYPLTTVKMDVVKQLSKSNINKLVIYYYLCDNVDYKQTIDLFTYSFSLLWVKEENRKSRSFRNKFLTETLKEIQHLSQDFKILINKDHITVRRIPDINIKHE